MAIHSISTCLWFSRDAEAAARLYCELIPSSRITSVHRWGAGGTLPEGTEMLVSLELGGVPFTFLNAGEHFTLTEAASIIVKCDTQEELDRVWDALLDGGRTMACGWLADRWGVSWQVLPAQLDAWVSGEPARASRTMQALMGMIKLDIAALQRAYDG